MRITFLNRFWAACAILVVAATTLLLSPCFQSANAAAQNHVTARLIAAAKKVHPGQPFLLGVELTMPDGWHTYYKDSGDAGMPTKITWTLPDGSKVGPIRWPAPKRFSDAGIVTYGYTGSTVLFCEVLPPENLNSKWFTARALVKWLECKDICIPGEAVLSLSLPVEQSHQQAVSSSSTPSAGSGSANVTASSDFKPTGFVYNGLGLATALLLALVGGFILNFMPCVLPVISIKVMNLVNEAHGETKAMLGNGIAFCLGIILSFEALALTIVAMQTAGQAVGWGFQFQYPEFSIAMAAIILVLALSLFGIFYIDVGQAANASGITKLAGKGSTAGAFFNGVLATILATPCTAPFLGTAMGFAFSQPHWVIITIFFAVGVGMSAPYLLLTANPKWVRFIPKPGDWMETFKQAMGFVLLFTVLWLLYVLSGQLGIEGVLSTLAFLLIVAFSFWLMSRLIDLGSSTGKKSFVRLSVLGVIAAAYALLLVPQLNQAAIERSQPVATTKASGPIDWQAFSDESLNQALQNKKTVLVDFTADWCLTCKVNEKTVLDSTPVVDKLKSLNIVTLRADWTNRNPEISALLKKFGRFGVPLYVIFPADKPNEPIVLPEVITQGIMLDALDKAGPSL
jgi:thiol:disulfide interchange protein DsbD